MDHVTKGPAEKSPPTPQDEWIDEGPSKGAARSQPTRRRSRSGQRRLTVEAPELVPLVGKKRAKVLEERLSDAATAYAAERYLEARKVLAPLVEEVPDLAEGRELLGLTLYRLGRWRLAANELEAFVELTHGSTEQHPVLADCYRALGRPKKVAELWDELREASPSAELVTEGRIVAAGTLADGGDLAGGIALLAKGFRFPRSPREYHLRRAYALADLQERSGDLPQARAMFARIAAVDPEFHDTVDRLDALG